MSRDGVHQWYPAGRWGLSILMTVYASIGVFKFVNAEDVVRQAGNAAFVVLFATLISTTLSRRVQADDNGLHVRGAWWSTRSVTWPDVVEVRPRRPRPRSPLIVIARDGRRLMTGLRTVDHPSLVAHWRVMTAQATLEDYVTAGYDGSR